MHRRRNRPRHVVPKLSVLLVVMLLVLTLAELAQAAEPAVIRLHDQVGTRGGVVQLQDVAELQGGYARSFANLTVAHLGMISTQSRGAAHRVCARVTLTEVRRRLQAVGANFGKLTLRGYTVCELRSLPHSETLHPSVSTKAVAAVVANPERQTVTLQTPVTLRERVEKLIRRALVDKACKPGSRRAPPSGKQWAMTFNENDASRLNRSALDAQYAFTPLSKVGLGRVTVRISRIEDGALREAFNVTATVQRRTRGVVMARSLRRGAIFTEADLTVEEVLVDTPHTTPLDSPQMIVGQVAASVMREGAIVFPQHVKAPSLVKRGDIVVVRCVVGGLMIRTSARATQDGALDDTIIVRNESTRGRETYAVRVTGKRQATLEEPPAALAAK